MFRTIAAAAIVFVFASFVLQKGPPAPFEEPILLLVMGGLFLGFGKLLGGEKRAAAPALIERRAA